MVRGPLLRSRSNMAGQQPQGNPPPPPPLLPDSTNEDGMVDTNWFKVVITKCPTGYSLIIALNSL